MLSMWSEIGLEIPLTLILLALLGLRTRINPKATLHVNVSPTKLFEVIDFFDGKLENWNRTQTLAEIVDPKSGLFRKTYVTTLSNGTEQRSSALFSIARREAPSRLEIRREGLEGKKLSNELLYQTYTVTPEKGGSRLNVCYNWGPRTLLSHLTARADLWGGAFRIKSIAETGVPNENPYFLISIAVALLTGLFSFATFAALIGVEFATLIIIALFVHEFGHLLAYWLMGQPWGRMIFLPFLGAIAVPRLPFQSQGQSVFAALMGPGVSVLFAIACGAACLIWPAYAEDFLGLGLITVALNLFNLLPVEPLDGGVALRSVLSRIMGAQARFGLMLVGLGLVIAGNYLNQILLVIFGGIAIIANIRNRTIDAGLTQLSTLQVCISFFGYAAVVTAYITMLRLYMSGAAALQSALHG
jgi:Zn-dependent protease